jgi:hypothetical protein
VYSNPRSLNLGKESIIKLFDCHVVNRFNSQRREFQYVLRGIPILSISENGNIKFLFSDNATEIVANI